MLDFHIFPASPLGFFLKDPGSTLVEVNQCVSSQMLSFLVFPITERLLGKLFGTTICLLWFISL